MRLYTATQTPTSGPSVTVIPESIVQGRIRGLSTKMAFGRLLMNGKIPVEIFECDPKRMDFAHSVTSKRASNTGTLREQTLPERSSESRNREDCDADCGQGHRQEGCDVRVIAKVVVRPSLFHVVLRGKGGIERCQISRPGKQSARKSVATSPCPARRPYLAREATLPQSIAKSYIIH